MSNNKEEVNPNFEHGVLYPIKELVDGVDVMLWRDKDSPYKAGLVRKDGDRYLLATSEYEANFYEAKYFTLYPKVKEPENIWDEYVDDDDDEFSGGWMYFGGEDVNEESIRETKALLAWQENVLELKKETS